MTYVLIEAWNARSIEAKEFFASLGPIPPLGAKLRMLRDDGIIEKLREWHYMCHRDRRVYWDDGRMAPMGHLNDLLELSRLFGTVFLEALERLKQERSA
jgi:hypothetical protein